MTYLVQVNLGSERGDLVKKRRGTERRMNEGWKMKVGFLERGNLVCF